jgi:hypothetical protein
MEKNNSYLIEVPGGKKLVAKLIKIENGFYFLKFGRCDIFFYCNKTKKIAISRFESGVACLEGTDHVILKKIN